MPVDHCLWPSILDTLTSSTSVAPYSLDNLDRILGWMDQLERVAASAGFTYHYWYVSDRKYRLSRWRANQPFGYVRVNNHLARSLMYRLWCCCQGRLMFVFGRLSIFRIRWAMPLSKYFFVARSRFLDFHGEAHSRLERNFSVYGTNPRRTWCIKILSPLLFFSPDFYMRTLHDLYVDQIVNMNNWDAFREKLTFDWRQYVLYVCAPALVGFYK